MVSPAFRFPLKIRKKTLKLIKVAVSTLGCKVNQCESAGILENLDASLFSIVPFHEKADCYIINTCSVTRFTDYQSRQMIRRAIKSNPDASVVVTGCYAQVAPEEIARIPGVHVIAGNAEKEKIPHMIHHIAKEKIQCLVGNISASKHFSAFSSSTLPGRTRAFLKIQDGCNSLCSYCIVPLARGPSRSLPEAETIRNLTDLAGRGYREIVLTGIHLGAYGQDLIPPSYLLNILEYVETHNTVERLRLSSIEITEITDDIIRLMKDAKTLCRHLHIPLQSGDDTILSAMGRNYSAAFFRNRVEEIVAAIPDIAIGIDVMVGFPGEGDEEFGNTFRLIENLPVAYLHVFPYSERPGTAAIHLPGRVNATTKKTRGTTLRRLGKTKRTAFGERFMGKKLSVLVEGKREKETGFMRGFSDNYISVAITNGGTHIANQIMHVIPYRSHDGKLFGRITEHDG